MASRLFPSRKLPLQFVLIAPFVLQLFAAVGLISYFSFRNSKAAVEDLVDQLTLRVDHVVEQHLDQYLEAPVRIAEATTDAIDSGLLKANDLKAIQRFLWHQARSSKITFANYGLSNGDYVGAGDYLGWHNTISETSARTQGKNYNYKTDAQGKATQLIEVDDYDHSQELWYSETMQAERPLWSDVYVWDDVSAAGPACRTR